MYLSAPSTCPHFNEETVGKVSDKGGRRTNNYCGEMQTEFMKFLTLVFIDLGNLNIN